MITADTKGKMMSYNGCKNYETWNVKLWIANDEGLYNFAASCKDYGAFKDSLREVGASSPISYETPDNVSWGDSSIDLAEMQEFWTENFSNVEA